MPSASKSELTTVLASNLERFETFSRVRDRQEPSEWALDLAMKE
jgi:hypothetical protein